VRALPAEREATAARPDMMKICNMKVRFRNNKHDRLTYEGVSTATRRQEDVRGMSWIVNEICSQGFEVMEVWKRKKEDLWELEGLYTQKKGTTKDETSPLLWVWNQRRGHRESYYGNHALSFHNMIAFFPTATRGYTKAPLPGFLAHLHS
jgi:hypothetical protein